jgi:hypothetical protein
MASFCHFDITQHGRSKKRKKRRTEKKRGIPEEDKAPSGVLKIG